MILHNYRFVENHIQEAPYTVNKNGISKYFIITPIRPFCKSNHIIILNTVVMFDYKLIKGYSNLVI